METLAVIPSDKMGAALASDDISPKELLGYYLENMRLTNALVSNLARIGGVTEASGLSGAEVELVALFRLVDDTTKQAVVRLCRDAVAVKP